MKAWVWARMPRRRPHALRTPHFGATLAQPATRKLPRTQRVSPTSIIIASKIAIMKLIVAIDDSPAAQNTALWAARWFANKPSDTVDLVSVSPVPAYPVTPALGASAGAVSGLAPPLAHRSGTPDSLPPVLTPPSEPQTFCRF